MQLDTMPELQGCQYDAGSTTAGCLQHTSTDLTSTEMWSRTRDMALDTGSCADEMTPLRRCTARKGSLPALRVTSVSWAQYAACCFAAV